jgi:hypothetical protein
MMRKAPWIAALLALAALAPASAVAASTDPIPGAIWTVPMGNDGGVDATPTDDVVVASCETAGDQRELAAARVGSSGSSFWELARSQAALGCTGFVGDDLGNTYFNGFDQGGTTSIESVDRSGGVRWATPITGFGLWRTNPILGYDGSVFFELREGGNVNFQVRGYDAATGQLTYEQGGPDMVGLYTYPGGIAEVNVDDGVSYFSYGGAQLGEVGPTPAVTNNTTSTNAEGADGAVFVSGYASSCSGGGHLSVSKMTPAGVAWTWTDTEDSCASLSLAATPGGGAAVALGEAGSAELISIGPDGNLRWRHHYVAATGGGAVEVLSDVNGVLALEDVYEYPDPVSGNSDEGTVIRYLDAVTGAEAAQPLDITDPTSGFYVMPFGIGMAINPGRVYVPEGGPASASAFAAPLGEDYRVSLQPSLAGSPPSAPLDPLPIPGQEPPPPSPPSSGGGRPTSRACAPVGGSFGQRLLGAATCVLSTKIREAQCDIAVAGYLFLPLKLVKAAELGSGLIDVGKITPRLQPTARLFNALSVARYTKSAPKGFRNPQELWDTIGKLKKGNELIAALPEIRRAISARDFSQVALDIADIAGLHACVEEVAGLST